MSQTIEYLWVEHNDLRKITLQFNEPLHNIVSVPEYRMNRFVLKPSCLFNDPFTPSFEQINKLVLCNIEHKPDSGLYEIIQTYYIYDSSNTRLFETNETFILLYEFTQAALYSGLNIVHNTYKGDYKWEIKLGIGTMTTMIQHTWIMIYIFKKYAMERGYKLMFEPYEQINDMNELMKGLSI